VAPIENQSVNFPYVWDSKQPGIESIDFVPSGQDWEDLKAEISTLFASKVEAEQVHTVVFRRGRVVVTFETLEQHQKFLELGTQGTLELVVRGVLIPHVSEGIRRETAEMDTPI